MKQDRCPTCKRLHRRSSESNRRYWLLLHRISECLKPDGNVFPVDSWHTFFKSRFLGVDEIKLPTGKTMLLPRSSADLDTAEFSDYMTRVEEFANSRNVYLEDEAYA